MDDQQMCLSGVDKASGQLELHRRVRAATWRGRSRWLAAGVDEVLQTFHVDHTGQQPLRNGMQHFGLAFEDDDGARAWAARNRFRLLVCSRSVAAEFSNKLRLPGIAAAAGVRAPRAVVMENASRHSAKHLWSTFDGNPVVVQRADNDLTGQGTIVAETLPEFLEVLTRWSKHRIKIAELIDGIPLTVSGCVSRSRTYVSGLSLQLVGNQRLTPHWGAHCGNRLVTDTELPDGVAVGCRAVMHAIGEYARSHGFLGQVGLDLVASNDGVWLIEINPRIHGVSSLLNRVESAAGLLPSTASHMLAMLSDADIEPVRRAAPAEALSQLVVWPRKRGVMCATPLRAGTYELRGKELTFVDRNNNPMKLEDAQAVIWPVALPGERLERSDRLAVLQFRHAVVDIQKGPALRSWTEPWISAVESFVTN